MSYSILKSFWELLAPTPPRRITPDPVAQGEYEDYDEIIAINEAKEVIILHVKRSNIKF